LRGSPKGGERPPLFVALALSILCLAARLPGLRSLPIFGDEAIHLHWAVLVREDPIRFAFVSMLVPLPPLHPWLLALVLPVARDPVVAGRLLSVLCGVLTVPAFCLLFMELHRRFAAGPESGISRLGIWIGGLLFVLCPYLAFSQRLALAEALFILEGTLAAWLAVRLAFEPRVSAALALGIVMAAAMLTRQNLSYVLWILPPIAYVLSVNQTERRWPFLWCFAVSLAVGLFLWLPSVLLVRETTLFERVFHSRLLAAPMSSGERLGMALRNSRDILGWFWTYLTPPVFLSAGISLVGLSRKGEKRLAVFLIVWTAALLLPLVLFGTFVFSRYGVLAAIPLLAAIALFLDRLELRIAPAAVIALALVAWPVHDLALQNWHWSRQSLVSVDRWQFITGWPAGAATQAAAEFLRNEAQKARLALIVPRNEGNPMDTLWLEFSRSPSVQTFGAGDVLREPLIREGDRPGTVLAEDDPWRRSQPRRIALVPGIAVYHVSPEPIYTPAGPVRSAELLSRLNPSLAEVARYWNPPVAATGRPTDGVVVYRVR
jgi:hypothetical protein